MTDSSAPATPAPSPSTASPRAQRRARIILGALLCLGMATAQTWPLAKKAGAGLVNAGEDPVFHTWALHAWHLRFDAFRVFPPYNANNFYPHENVLFFSDSFLGQALLSWPLHLVGLDPYLVHNLTILLLAFLMAFCTWLSAFWLCGSVWGATAAAAAAAFSQHRYGFLDHLNIMSGFLLPVAAAALLQLWHKPGWRRAVGAGLALGFVWWFSAQLAVFTLVAAVVPLGLASAVAVWTQPDNASKKALALQLLAVGAIMLVVAAPILHGHMLVQDAVGQERTLEDNVNYAIPPGEFLASAQSSVLQRLYTKTAVVPLYLGHSVVLLALLAFVRALRRKDAPDAPHTLSAHAGWALFGTGLLSGVFSLGPLMRPDAVAVLPYYYLLKYFPPLLTLRAPARFFVPLSVCLALLAAFPVARLAAALAARKAWMPILSALVPAFIVLDLWTPAFPVNRISLRSQAVDDLAKSHPGVPLVDIPDGRPENNGAVHRSIYHDLQSSAGMSGTTPPLTGALRCRSNRFPLPDAIETFQTLGIGFVAAHRQRPFVNDVPVMNGVTMLTQLGNTRIFSVPPGTPALYDVSFLHGKTRPLRVAGNIPPDRMINAAVDLRDALDRQRATVRPAARVTVELRRGDTVLSRQKSRLRLPALLEAATPWATVSFDAPDSAGPLQVRVLDGEHLLAQGDTLVDAGVKLGAELTPDALVGVTMEMDAAGEVFPSGRCGSVRVTVKNGTRALLQAYPQRLALPMEAGKVVLDLEFGVMWRVTGTGRAHQWQTRSAVLWHDLGPGEETTVTANVESPIEMGKVELRGNLMLSGGFLLAKALTPVEVVRLTP